MKAHQFPTIKNMTLSARISKLFPASDLHLKLERAQKTQDEFRKKLAADHTKTQLERDRLYSQSGQKQAESLIPAVQSLHEQTFRKITGFEQRIGEMMKFRGTTDLVVLNSTATAMLAGGFPVTQIYSMARTDSDVARAVLLSPALKYGLELDQKTRDSFKTLVEQQALGSEYVEYQNTQRQADLVSDLGKWLMDALTGYTSILNHLEQGRVVSLPEAG